MGMELKSTAIAAIDRLADLPEGWDSYEAPRISEQSRESAKGCLNQVQRLLGSKYANPVVGPTADGGVALSWRKERGPEVDLICSAIGARYVVLSPDGQVVGQSELHFTECSHFAFQVLKRLDL